MNAPAKTLPFLRYCAGRWPNPEDVLATYFDHASAAAESIGAAPLEELPILDGKVHYMRSKDGRCDKRQYYRASIEQDADGTIWPRITFCTFRHGGQRLPFDPRNLAWQEFTSSKGLPANDNAECLDVYREKAADLAKKWEERTAALAAEEAEGKEAAAYGAAVAWEAASEATEDHPYLACKGVPAIGLRVASKRITAQLRDRDTGEWDARDVCRAGDLLIPMRDAQGRIRNLQRITKDGQKLFLTGGQVKGLCHTLPGTGDAWLAEGYATAASVNMATAAPVVVGFTAGNLPHLSSRASYVAADNDEKQAGEKAAKATGLPWRMPPDVGQDWNDYAAAHGVEAVRAALLEGFTVGMVAPAANDNAPAIAAAVDVHDMPHIGMMTWPHTGSNGQPLNTIPNLAHLLGHYGFVVRYDVIRKDLRITYPGQTGTLDNQRSKAFDTVLSLCALNRLPKSDTQSFLLSIGDDNAVNPVMDFITSKPWDGRSRFADLLDTVQTRQGYDRELLAMLLRRWMISAVAAAAKPFGFWSKGVLVFQGEQSLGKTAWIRSLLPEGLRDLVKIDATINPDNKDTIISAVSHWLVELGELDGTLRKADIARLKGFISQDVDQFRRPYGRVEEKFQRRTVFFASVNPEQFLADDTGNVRWWTVPVAAVNYSHTIDMQQMWAEVFAWYEAGERWWLERDEEARLEAVNASHQQAEPIEELIMARYSAGGDWPAPRRMTASEILVSIGYDKPTKAQLNSAANALRKLFGEPKKTKAGRFYEIPAIDRPY